MTLWHKPTETAKGHGLVVIKNGKNIGVMTAYEHRSQAPAGKWCYLTELLKLEQENKKLQEKLEIAVKAFEDLKSMKFKESIIKQRWGVYRQMINRVDEALAKIKEIK